MFSCFLCPPHQGRVLYFATAISSAAKVLTVRTYIASDYLISPKRPFYRNRMTTSLANNSLALGKAAFLSDLGFAPFQR
jgi:hypothetical protein